MPKWSHNFECSEKHEIEKDHHLPSDNTPLLMQLSITVCWLGNHILSLAHSKQNLNCHTWYWLSHCYPMLSCMVVSKTSFCHRLLGLSSQFPDPLEKPTSSQVSLCYVPRPSPNPVSQETVTAFVTIAGCLFTSKLENVINKSNKKEVQSMRKSGDNDLLLLLLFPTQMVL